MIVIEPGLVSNPVVPLTHARIGHDTITRLTGAEFAASSEADGFPAVAAGNPLTYDRWLPDGLPTTWQVNAGSPQAVDYLGIASHSLADGGSTVFVESSIDGSIWTPVGDHTPLDNSEILFLFEEITAQFWRIRITGTSPQPVGVVYVGKALAMQRPIFSGHSPIILSRSNEIRPTRSDGGQFLGRSVIRQGYRGRFGWTNLKSDWYRQNFDPFVVDAIKYPFFIAWRPSFDENDVVYGWADGDIAPSNTGTRDFMSVRLGVTAIGSE